MAFYQDGVVVRFQQFGPLTYDLLDEIADPGFQNGGGGQFLKPSPPSPFPSLSLFSLPLPLLLSLPPIPVLSPSCPAPPLPISIYR
jgi:hypothetical protein